ncbi:Cytochrome-c oxidase [Fasciola gigantica]|uniref:Cytochrome-c oxidase n=1 Tax=Fasciola gigantica TaxID=46835 RepID=A0A504Z1I3_FASGI|nr:Cytochrome-c oxidase [Fasciola gigantica]
MFCRISRAIGRHVCTRPPNSLTRNFGSGSSATHSDEIASFPILADAIKDRNYRLVSWLITEQDPYEIRRVQMPSFTSVSQPTLVASDAPSRMIGCVCEPEADAINWMELKKGDPVQCYCGHWFQLVSYEEYFKQTGY